MGINDIEITKLLQNHYDTTEYGLRWAFLDK
jgi:Ni,Fe-hydrogenase III small subunit